MRQKSPTPKRKDAHQQREALGLSRVNEALSGLLPRKAQAKADADLAARDRQIRHLAEEVAAKLESGKISPLLEALQRSGPRLLAQESVMKALERRWIQIGWIPPGKGQKARHFFERIGAKLAIGSPMGRPQIKRTEKAKKQLNQERQQQYRDKDASAMAKLRKTIKEKEQECQDRQDWRNDPQAARKYRAAVAEATKEILEKALNSSDPHRRNAANRLKKSKEIEERRFAP
jgi:hypothetical protein